MSRLTLYTTLGCHLCELLEAELARLGSDAIELVRVEIADHDSLIERYGTRIPVLVDGQGNELDRGFEKARLSAWLEARGLLAAAVDQAAREPDERPVGARRIRGRRFLG